MKQFKMFKDPYQQDLAILQTEFQGVFPPEVVMQVFQ